MLRERAVRRGDIIDHNDQIAGYQGPQVDDFIRNHDSVACHKEALADRTAVRIMVVLFGIAMIRISQAARVAANVVVVAT